MAKVKKQAKYSEDSITVMEGLEGVRKRPGMYLGERGPQMAFRCGKEGIDNVLDEYLAGRNDRAEFVYLPKDGTFIIGDNAEGIPVGVKKGQKVSTLTLIMTKLHAGGKFNDKAYKTSAGTHGVGISAVNAVSSLFEVWTHRDGKWHYQSFKQGKPVKDVKAGVKPPSEVTKHLKITGKKGTVLRFVLDQSIVSHNGGKTMAKLDVKDVRIWLKNLAMMNRNFRVRFHDGKKEFDWVNKEGVSRLLKQRLVRDDLEGIGKVISFDSDNIALAMQWSTYTEDDGLKSYVSCSPTSDGGSHADELFNALNMALKPFKGKRDKYSPKDIRNGLVGVFNWRMHGAEFNSQLKHKLSSDLNKQVYNQLFPFFTKFFAKHKSLARKIIRRANDVKKSKEELSKAMRGIAEMGSAKRSGAMLPTVLTTARCKPDERELFLVEGDSAGGTAKEARDKRFQEVLKLRGKLTNALRAKLSAILQGETTQTILVSMGYNHALGAEAVNKLRIKAIYLLADADHDGKHINALILSLIWKLMPKLFEQGRVFVCNAPLFSAYYKGNYYFGDTHQDCHAGMPKGAPKSAITRAKGWGELSPEVLEIIAFRPDTRNVIQVKPSEGNDLEYFKRIMGSDSSARKELLGLD